MPAVDLSVLVTTADIDGLDPAFAPGTGTPEIGGLTSIQGLEIIRGCQGLNIVGGDLVETAPSTAAMAFKDNTTIQTHGENLAATFKSEGPS